MNARALLDSHRYAEAIEACRPRLEVDPQDWEAVGVMGGALRASGASAEALPWFEQLCEEEQRRPFGDTSWPRINIVCLHWCLGAHAEALAMMHGLVGGVLDRSIQYGDMAGGVSQGLLLHYMAVTLGNKTEEAYALSYLENRARRKLKIAHWPGPAAQYLLGKADFEDVLVAATGQRTITAAVRAARTDLLRRRALCGALFHDGIMFRKRGSEEQCLTRMHQCFALEDPLIEQEWYLARYEVERAAGTT